MDLTINDTYGIPIAAPQTERGEIRSVNDALDLMALVYSHDVQHMVIQADQLAPAFYDLKTGIAGEILQKFTQYGVRLAIVGDFDHYESNSLQAFIRECNRGSQLFFCASDAEAQAQLTGRRLP